MLKNLLDLLSKKDFVYSYEINNNSLQVRINDPYLTDELYENGIYISNEFKKILKDEICKFNSLINNVKVVYDFMDKDWINFNLEIKN